MNNLFGLPTPGEVRANANRRLFGSLPQYNRGVLGQANMGAAAIGMGLGRLFGGQSAGEQRAQSVQDILKATQQKYGDFDPTDMEQTTKFGQTLVGNLMQGNQTEAALNVANSLSKIRTQGMTQPRKWVETPKGFVDPETGQYKKDAQGNILMPLNAPSVAEERTERTGRASNRIRIENEAFEQIGKINTNVSDLNEALRLVVEEGAGSGAIESRLPSWKSSTIELENMQKKLGLNVVGAVTFGALSKGEMDIAMATALPTGLDRDALARWIRRKSEAQQKLANYYSEQISYFQTKGATKTGWLKRQKVKKNANKSAGRFKIEIIE